jgi:hypothetical protein
LNEYSNQREELNLSFESRAQRRGAQLVVLPALRAARMRQLSHELLPGTNRRENQEFETNVPAAHGSTAALGVTGAIHQTVIE